MVWFLAIFFMMATEKRGISSVGLARLLGISQKKAWFMLHKLRKAMAVRNGRYELDGFVELGESFFGASKEGGGRGTDKKKVLVGLSLTKDGKRRYLCLRVLPHINRANLMPALEEMITPGTTLKTDGLRSYLGLAERGYQHERVIATQTEVLFRAALDSRRPPVVPPHMGEQGLNGEFTPSPRAGRAGDGG